MKATNWETYISRASLYMGNSRVMWAVRCGASCVNWLLIASQHPPLVLTSKLGSLKTSIYTIKIRRLYDTPTTAYVERRQLKLLHVAVLHSYCSGCCIQHLQIANPVQILNYEKIQPTHLIKKKNLWVQHSGTPGRALGLNLAQTTQKEASPN